MCVSCDFFLNDAVACGSIFLSLAQRLASTRPMRRASVLWASRVALELASWQRVAAAGVFADELSAC